MLLNNYNTAKNQSSLQTSPNWGFFSSFFSFLYPTTSNPVFQGQATQICVLRVGLTEVGGGLLSQSKTLISGIMDISLTRNYLM